MDRETMGLSEALKYAIYGLSELPNRSFTLDDETHNTASLIEILMFVFYKYTTLTLHVREPIQDTPAPIDRTGRTLAREEIARIHAVFEGYNQPEGINFRELTIHQFQ